MMLLWLLPVLQQTEKVSIPQVKYDFELVRVPGGKFRLGSPDGEPGRDADEGPAREAEVHPFWMARTEVTWDAFVEYFERREAVKVDGVTRPSSPYEPPNGEMGTGRHCAVGMRWHGAVGFCAWLSKRTGQKFRLPTETEWEYAARAGSTGPGPDTPDACAWFAANASKKTHEVGKKAPNAFGLHDMLGNVWEYCLEPYRPGEYEPVIRGGAWHSPPEELRFANRQVIKPEWFSRDPNRPRSLWWLTDARFVGFRVVRMGEAAAQEAQRAYAAKVEIRNLKRGEAKKNFFTVTGEVVNTGDRPLWEVELTVYSLDGEGKPLFEDQKARATHTLAYPVLVNAYHAGDASAPLKPGESRRFSVLVPEAYEIDEIPDKVGAEVSGIRFGD